MTKAAEARVGAADTALGEMYAAGRGVPSSDTDATRWFSAANDARDAHGTYELGVFIAQGRAKGDIVQSSHQARNQSFGSSDVLHSRSGACLNWSVVASLWHAARTSVTRMPRTTSASSTNPVWAFRLTSNVPSPSIASRLRVESVRRRSA